MPRKSNKFSPLSWGLVLVTLGVSACGRDGGTIPNEFLTEMCDLIQADLISAATKDGIPALSDPELVAVGDPGAAYLLDTDRVIGLEVAGEFVAFPHNILWWHEIVNLNEVGLAVTYCPLTGSSMVFEREAADGAEFGTSGLLFKNNLVMYDRSPTGAVESLWPQMLAGGRCGPGEGRQLGMVPALEIEWEDWVALHPDTRVLSQDTGFPRNYTRYPYGDYEVELNERTLFPHDNLDRRRPPKERVLGIPSDDGRGIAFPFGALRDAGELVAVHETVHVQGDPDGEEPIVVFWNGAASAAMAYRPSSGGQSLTFEVTDGAFVDAETGSHWSIEGQALSGPLEGERLEAIPEAYVSFWFAFSTFFPSPKVWLP